jgi:hypothetical protein
MSAGRMRRPWPRKSAPNNNKHSLRSGEEGTLPHTSSASSYPGHGTTVTTRPPACPAPEEESRRPVPRSRESWPAFQGALMPSGSGGQPLVGRGRTISALLISRL